MSFGAPPSERPFDRGGVTRLADGRQQAAIAASELPALWLIAAVAAGRYELKMLASLHRDQTRQPLHGGVIGGVASLQLRRGEDNSKKEGGR